MTPNGRIRYLSNPDLLLCRTQRSLPIEWDEANLPIEGEIPSGLNGVSLCNGPNSLFQPVGPASLVGGARMVHALYLENGAARYRNRWLRTEELLAGQTAGRHPANGHIVCHAGNLLAMGESGFAYRLDWDLNTLGRNDFEGIPPGAMSSHPKIDPETGEMVLVTSDARECRLDCLTVNAHGQLARVLSFDCPWPALVHDIAVTRNYVVVLICPYVMENPAPCWRPVMGTAVALIPRRGTEQGIRWLETRPFFHAHVMNAFEKDQYIELQLPWYSSWGTTAPIRAELHRLRINLENRTILDEQIDDCACEFPRINDRFAMRENRFGYAAFRNARPGETPEAGMFEALARYDFHTGSRAVHTLPSGEFVGEAVFVPAQGARDEADGYLMAFVYNAVQDASSLRIYDAQNLHAASPLALIQLPCPVPAGCHGSWVERPGL